MQFRRPRVVLRLKGREKAENEVVMKKFILLAVTLAATVAICSAQSSQKLQLRAGQQKAAGNLTVKFVAVTEDSRCPSNVVCVWSGVAKVKVQLRRNGKTAEFELNTNQLDKPAVLDGYSVKLVSVAPYPKTSAPITRADYVANFAVAKSGK